MFWRKKLSIGERALKEVAQMLMESWQERKLLRDNQWERVLHPPLVNNEGFGFIQCGFIAPQVKR